MLLTPNSPNADCSNSTIHDNGMFTARSRHSGGVNGLMGDGSVKFIKSSISMTTWWALGTRNNGEVISAGGSEFCFTRLARRSALPSSASLGGPRACSTSLRSAMGISGDLRGSPSQS